MARTGPNVRRVTRSNGTTAYEARWTDPNGKTRQVTRPTRQEAIDARTLLRSNELRGQAPDHDKAKTPFPVYADLWLQRIRRRQRIRPQTIDGYAATLNTHARPYFQQTPIGRITTASLNAFVDHLQDKGLKPQTVKNAFYPVASILRMAKQEGAIHTSPADGVDLPQRSSTPTHRTLPANSHARVAQHMDAIDQLMFDVLTALGLRAAELAGLERRDVSLPDVGTPTITISRTKRNGQTFPPKTQRSTRRIELPPWLADRLRTHLAAHPNADPEAPLFPLRLRTATTRPFDWTRPPSMPAYLRRFRQALAAAGLDPRTRVHDLRHTFTTAQLAAGVPLYDVSLTLGHANTGTTQAVYAHLDLATGASTVPDPYAEPRSATPLQRRKAAR